MVVLNMWVKYRQTRDAEIVKKNELIQLRKELNEAVERENYEKAAELRDKIYELSGNVEDGD